VDEAEVKRLAALEDRHWWYAARRTLIRKHLDGVRPGRAIDVGAAGGGNTRLLRDLGWQAVALEYSPAGAAIARQRDVEVVRADAHRLPIASNTADLVVAFDIIEHLENDDLAVSELRRITAPGGKLLLAVPADPTLWSEHDVAVGHLRRYTRETLTGVLARAGYRLDDLRSWNVLLRPMAAIHRKRSTGSDLAPVPAPLNVALSAVIRVEQWFPSLSGRRGVSLMATATRPADHGV
jgi:SAM-dependent methyltransferase